VVASLKNSSQNKPASEPLSILAPAPMFDFGQFFHGHTRASGWFADRFGAPRRHFCGDFYGYYDQGRFTLDEKLYYTDGMIVEQIWKVHVTDDGIFTAESNSLTTDAKGAIRGDTLTMKYSMDVKIDKNTTWNLRMKDIMTLQPDGSLHNINHVYKWGMRIGTVSAHYVNHDGDRLCMPANADHKAAKTGVADFHVTGESATRHLSSVDR